MCRTARHRPHIGERYLRIERDNAALRQKIASATNSLARTFDRIVGLLTERGFITAAGNASVGAATAIPKVTNAGRLLARIYSESDLLVAECLRTGAWNGLAPAELAAVISAVVYESRGSDGPSAPLQVAADGGSSAGVDANPAVIRAVARR